MNPRCADAFSGSRDRLNRSPYREPDKADQCGAKQPEGGRQPKGLTGAKPVATNSVIIYYKTKACRKTESFNKPHPVITPGSS